VLVNNHWLLNTLHHHNQNDMQTRKKSQAASLSKIHIHYLNITFVIIGTNLSRWAPLPNDIRFNKVR